MFRECVCVAVTGEQTVHFFPRFPLLFRRYFTKMMRAGKTIANSNMSKS